MARKGTQWAIPTLLSLLVLAGSIAVAVLEPQAIGTLRDEVFDAYQQRSPRAYRPVPVRFVDLDDASLERIGQWPWSRAQVAELVDRLRDLGAAAIAFDIAFAEPDRTAPAAVFRDLESRPELRRLIAEIPDPDQVLAARIAVGKVVTGFVLTQDEEPGRAPAEKASLILAGDDPRPFLPAFSSAVSSLPALEAGAAGNGALNIAPSSDGVVRRVQLLIRLGDTIYPTLTAEALRVTEGSSNYLVKSSGASGESRWGGKTGLISIKIGDRVVQTDAQGGLWLHYSERVPERTVPAWRVLNGEVEEGSFAGATVFIGTSAAGLKDLRFNTLGEVVAGAEMHTQAVEQILDGTYLRRPDWAKAAEILFMILMWAVLVPLVFRFGAIPAALIGTLVGLLSVAGSWMAFQRYSLLLDPVFPGLMALAVYLVCSVSRQLQTEREKRWIRGAFASYISPNLVHYLIDNPQELSLGGARRECSFVMTDLAGFTSMVESSDPAMIIALLNEYLDGMVSVALKHEGTLDRIVGDAVAVMFSAPVTQPDHAERAVLCALEMDDFASGFQARKRAEGLPLGNARIGVNTGTVTIGNVGGASIVDYRALGDPVNTAARLETVNKHLGTRICVSGSTVAGVPNFTGRPVGALVLKGKTEAVEAWEPLRADELRQPRIVDYLAAFELLKAGDAGAKAAFEELATKYPEDPLVQFHLGRLQAGESGARVVMAAK